MGFLKKAILLAALSLFAFPALASEALVASETDVDMTGKDAAEARDLGLARGELDALTALLGKLTTPEQVNQIIDSLNAEKISAMVRGTEITNEKIGGNRYRAHLVVTFDGAQISSLIGANGSGAATKNPDQAPAVGSFLVLPIYEENGKMALWEDDNPWREAWKSAGLEVTAGDIIVPFGDNADASVVNAQTAASATYASLTPLTVRYGVSDVVILQAKFTQRPDITLSVVKRRLNRTENEVNLLTYRADLQETKEMLLSRAARDIADILEHKKSEEMQAVRAVKGGERNRIMVLATISTLNSWTQIRGKLTKLPMVDELEMLAVSPQQVDMVVHYRGTPESLANAITAQNLRLIKKPTYWVVSRD